MIRDGYMYFDNPRAQEIADRIQAKLAKFDSASNDQFAAFQFLENGLNEALNLINGTTTDLQKLKEIVGSYNEDYKDLSSAVVGTCIPLLRHQGMQAHLLSQARQSSNETDEVRDFVTRTKENSYKALKLMELIGANFDMTPDIREIFNQDLASLKNVNQKANSSGGCYIATYVYGGYDSREVIIFRDFRDRFLMTNILGKALVFVYYKISPRIVKKFGASKAFHKVSKSILDRVMRIITNE